MPKLSFIVPLFNHVQQTQEMLASLLASLPQGLHFELIFADDASTDGTRDWLSTLSDSRIQFTLNEHNMGYAKTNNVAASLATGQYVALLNNDLVFEPGWIEPMLEALDSTELNAGIVGNLQYRVVDGALDHAGVVLTPRGQFDHIREEPAAGDQALEVYATTGACMLMRRADFEAVGGFDEIFVNGCEDIDLCFKLRSSGKKIYVVPNSKILHHVSLSRSRVSLQNEKNSQYLYSKWRQQIKLQLSKNWIGLLRKPNSVWQDYIDGVLTSSMLSQPHLAATTIAEAALRREEARWARELSYPVLSDIWKSNVHVKGVTPVSQVKSNLSEAEVIFTVDELKTAQNFYVCGKLLTDFEPNTLAVVITLNGQQMKTSFLENRHVINVGIINPLISPAAKNQFSIKFFFKNDAGEFLAPATNAVLISHFVVDDQVINQFHT